MTIAAASLRTANDIVNKIRDGSRQFLIEVPVGSGQRDERLLGSFVELDSSLQDVLSVCSTGTVCSVKVQQ